MELSKYFPKFSSLREGIFLGNEKDILEYNFKLSENIKYKKILNVLISHEEIKNICQECCLVKNTHHVKGELELIKKKEYIKYRKFHLIFKQKSTYYKTCNNYFKIFQDDISNKDPLCFGSIFPCPSKEYNKAIIIKSKDVLYFLFRVYFHRISAIEIFTSYNKSYYFNFCESFEINNFKKNKIINEIKLNPYFKEIKMKKGNFILGFYNTRYESYLFPLFKEEINSWEEKIKYYCNYDTLILINLFSNRSFKDIYQYPIFPTLYDWINLKRNIEECIGFQDITNESKLRKELIIQTYVYNL